MAKYYDYIVETPLILPWELTNSKYYYRFVASLYILIFIMYLFIFITFDNKAVSLEQQSGSLLEGSATPGEYFVSVT